MVKGPSVKNCVPLGPGMVIDVLTLKGVNDPLKKVSIPLATVPVVFA
jgi:hypothetical protein